MIFGEIHIYFPLKNRAHSAHESHLVGRNSELSLSGPWGNKKWEPQYKDEEV